MEDEKENDEKYVESTSKSRRANVLKLINNICKNIKEKTQTKILYYRKEKDTFKG